MSQPPEGQIPEFDGHAGPHFRPNQPPEAPSTDPNWPAPPSDTQSFAQPTAFPPTTQADQADRLGRPNFAGPDGVQPPEPVRQQAEPTEQQWQQWAKPVAEVEESQQEAELAQLSRQYEGSDPFEPAGIQFTPVSEDLIKLRYWNALIWLVIMLIAMGLPMFLIQLKEPFSPWWWALCLIPLAIFGWLMWLIPRQVRAMGYAETDSEFIVRKGIMWRSLVAVPYGRLQYVDVNAGPLQRMLGLTTVQLHTASASTDANLPGLPPAEAARLRDRLSEAGESQLAGL